MDLVVFASLKQSAQVSKLREAFDESSLPFRVDLFVWDDVPDEFRRHIAADHVVLVRSREIALAGEYENGSDEIRTVTLNDVADILMGQSPPGSTYNETGDGPPFFQGVRDFSYRFPTPRVYCSAPSRIAHPGDILLSIRAPIGRVNIAPEECAIGRGLACIRPRNERDARFLEFALRSLETHWTTIEGSGSVFGNATRSDLESLELPWPSQRHDIARILGALDDKIELNRRMNQTLEEIARALFKSWFIDFDPVRAKAALKQHTPKHHSAPTGEPSLNGATPAAEWTVERARACLTGLDPQIADLFPDRLVPSELGEIPEGWKIRPLVQDFRITMGQSPPGKTYNQIGIGMPLYQGRTDFGFRYPGYRVYCDAPTRLAKPGDTLVSVRAPVGDVNMTLDECCIGRGVAAVRHSSDSKSYTYYSMRALRPTFNLFEAEGTVFGSLSKTSFHSMARTCPVNRLVAEFDSLCSPIDSHIEANELEIATLATQRDALLPKLVTGELRAKEIVCESR